MPPEAVRYCGRLFSEQELQLIRTIIAEDSSRHRFALSQVVCERLHWRRANGQLKDMSCRVAMLRMHRDRLIPLPAPRRRHSNGTLHRRRTPQAEPELPIIARVDALPALQVRPLADQREAQLWREYVDRYHYLGYTPLPGAQMRYLVTSQRRVLAVVGFGASAWKAAPRDRFIGWSVAQREARLQLVVNNARFLILPWVQVHNLASTVLARSSRRLPDDCQARYGYRPLLLETFVQSDRFAGTSCRAANWTHVGQTQGRGKLDVHRTHALPRKDIWLYPLRRDFRRRLCTPLDPHPNQTMRMTRTMMLEVLRQDYVRTAWSKGLKERVVIVRHAIKNALIPVVTLIGLQLPILIGGSVIMESIFGIPGLGRLMLDALNDRDYPVVSGINLTFAAAVMGINLMVDLIYAVLDPRVGYR